MERYKLLLTPPRTRKGKVIDGTVTLSVRWPASTELSEDQLKSGKHFVYISAYSNNIDSITYARVNDGYVNYGVTDYMTLEQCRTYVSKNIVDYVGTNLYVLGLVLEDRQQGLRKVLFDKPIPGKTE